MKLDFLLDLKRLLHRDIVDLSTAQSPARGQDRRRIADRRSSTRPNRSGHSRRVTTVDRRDR